MERGTIGGIPGPKRIATGPEARAALLRGAAIVGHVVGSTLGPGGRAVLIERRHARPWVSSDGYTVARHIDLAGRFEDMGGRLIRHVGSRVSDEVGDGSTTAMVLAAALLAEGQRATAAGADLMTRVAGTQIVVVHGVPEPEPLRPLGEPGQHVSARLRHLQHHGAGRAVRRCRIHGQREPEIRSLRPNQCPIASSSQDESQG